MIFFEDYGRVQSNGESMKINRQEALEQLVDELMKDSPNLDMVRKLSRELGVPYVESREEQLANLINCLDAVSMEFNKKPNFEDQL